MNRFKSRMIVCIILAALALLIGTASALVAVGTTPISAIVVLGEFSNDGTGVGSIGGYAFVPVQGNSMKPEFSRGDLIVVKKANTEQRTQYKEGDVITYFYFQSDGSYFLVTSRVQKVEELAVTTYTVLGDNKDYDLTGGKGERVFCTDVLGHYTGIAIPGMGSTVNFANTLIGSIIYLILTLLSILITLACLAVLLMGVIGAIVSGIRLRRKIA